MQHADPGQASIFFKGALGFGGLGFRGLGFRGLGFRGLGFRGLGFRGLGFRGLGFRGLGFRVLGLGFWVQEASRSPGCNFRVFNPEIRTVEHGTAWEFPKIRGTLFWGPYNKDPTIRGTFLGSPIFGNSHLN